MDELLKVIVTANVHSTLVKITKIRKFHFTLELWLFLLMELSYRQYLSY